MSDSIKLLLFVGVLITAFVGYQVYQELKDTKKTAEISCLASITDATSKAWQSGQIKLNEKSRELTKEEITELIKNGKIGDCGGKEYVFENLHIAIGEVNKTSKGAIRVWINGDDGISGTSDDVIHPWEENNN